MQLKLEKILSALTVIAAFAYSLGWLKTYSYFQTFGIGLGALDLSIEDYLFESWYVLENVLFFLLMGWLAVKSKRVWVYVLWALYLTVPLGTHAAYQYRSWFGADWLIGHQHTVLKFVPFVVLAILWLADRGAAKQMADMSWPHGRFAGVVFLLVTAAWAISAAKHFGGGDANQVLLDPATHLSRVRLHVAEDVPPVLAAEPEATLYLLYASPNRYFVWDTSGFSFFQPPRRARVLIVPRENVKWIETWKEVQVQPGSLLF